MRQLLSELLRIAELEIPKAQERLAAAIKRADEFKGLVLHPPKVETPRHSAIDSGYVLVEYRYFKLYIVDIVVVSEKIINKTIFISLNRDKEININRKVRELELEEAKRLDAYVLVDGPISPYLAKAEGLIIGVSKDPVAARYGPAVGGDAGRWFAEVASVASELYAAELLLKGEPPGAMLKPARVGPFLGTYVRGDSVFYVEFPPYVPEEVIASFFSRGYPIKLRLAHKYAKISGKYLETVKTIFPRFLEGVPNKYRDFL
jgi:hypothetical protein|nr:MAG: nuclease NurA [Thermoproteus sp. AZ2]